jgi:hypothetical protein
MMFNLYNLNQLLARYGYVIERVDTCHQPFAQHRRLFVVGAGLLRAWPRWGGTLFVVAKPATTPGTST